MCNLRSEIVRLKAMYARFFKPRRPMEKVEKPYQVQILCDCGLGQPPDWIDIDKYETLSNAKGVILDDYMLWGSRCEYRILFNGEIVANYKDGSFENEI